MKNKSLLFLLSTGLILSACNGGDEDFEEGADPAEDGTETETDGENGETAGEPQEGGNINLAMYSAPDHQFNPIYYQSSYDNNILEFTHEKLFEQNEDLEFYGELAEEYELNDEQTEMTVQLREDVVWHDGEPFTADDVVFTYTAIADPGYTGVRTSYADSLLGYDEFKAGDTEEFEGVEAVDEHTVVFRWEEPTVTPEYDASFFIIPEHVFGDVPADEMEQHSASSNPGEIIGTGPFEFTAAVEGDRYELEAFEDYWKGRPHLDSVTWRVVDQSVMTGLLDNGEIHMVAEPDGIVPNDVESVEALGNVNLYQPQDLGYQYMGLKLAHRPSEDVEAGVVDPDNFIINEKLEDKRVRQALVYGINREAMIEGLLHGSGEVLHAPFPEASWAYDEDAPVKYEYDPDQARALLEDAGFEDVTGDGFYEDPDGEEYVLNLEYPTGNEARENAALVIGENLQDIGINVNVQQPREFSAHADRVEDDERSMDLYLMGWSLASGDPDPAVYFQSDVAYNYTRWNDEHSDELIAAGVQAPEAFDEEYRMEVYAEWAEHVSEEVPMVFLWSPINNFAYVDSLQGVTEHPANMYKDTHEWYLAE
ncbi:ABC transporter substrate-binding protein [Bacillus sp. FJAT-44742]|uniref:ABC transporter substrate-binding protein n=1 Tax=Bacillus sp. FJAT-44742 TaxID=2014005 RepID=UPI000C244703|nr:ABC transporter substrate-binding protein [Bacillus sp. FJAT-44742]